MVQKLDAMRARVDRTQSSLAGVQGVHGIDHGMENPIKPTEHVDTFGPPDKNTPAGARMDDAANRQKGVDALGAKLAQNGKQIGGASETRDKSTTQYRDSLPPDLKPLFDKLTPDQQLKIMTGTD
jgi:hypothetical protein